MIQAESLHYIFLKFKLYSPQKGAYETSALPLVRCRELGNPLRDQFASLIARNKPAFVGIYPPDVD
jgi:hypothetical protein